MSKKPQQLFSLDDWREDAKILRKERQEGLALGRKIHDQINAWLDRCDREGMCAIGGEASEVVDKAMCELADWAHRGTRYLLRVTGTCQGKLIRLS